MPEPHDNTKTEEALKKTAFLLKAVIASIVNDDKGGALIFAEIALKKVQDAISQ